MRRALLALTLGLPGTATAAELGTSQHFGDWIVACDNTRACTAIGLAHEGAPAFAYLTVTRAGGPDAQPAVSISILDELDTGGSIRLTLGNGAALPVEVLDPRAEETDTVSAFATGDLGTETVRPLLAALVPAPAIEVSIGSVAVPVSLDGMSAALRFMDAAQERAGTAAALVVTGERPENTVPAAPEPPALTALALTEIDAPGTRPARLPVADEYCPEGLGDTVFEAENGVLLWGVCSSAGAYNTAVDFSIVTDGQAVPADLGPAGTGISAGESESGSTLVNPVLAPDGRTIQAFARARGLGDCGSATAWVFDGTALRLAEEAFMGECRGVQPDDWPVLYRAAIQ